MPSKLISSACQLCGDPIFVFKEPTDDTIVVCPRKHEIINQIDKLADSEGCDRSAYLRKLVGEKLHSLKKETR